MQFGVLQNLLDLIPDEINYSSVMSSKLVEPFSSTVPPPFSLNGFVVFDDANYKVSFAFVEALENLYMSIGPLFHSRESKLFPSSSAFAQFLLSCVDFKILETREYITQEKYVYLHNKSLQFFEFLLQLKQMPCVSSKMFHETEKNSCNPAPICVLEPKIRLCPLHQIVHLYSFFKCIQDMLLKQQVCKKTEHPLYSSVVCDKLKDLITCFDKLTVLVQNSESRVLHKVQTNGSYSDEMLEILLLKQYTDYTKEILAFFFQSVDFDPLDTVQLNYVVLAFVRLLGLTSGRLFTHKDKTFSKMSDYENHLTELMWSQLWQLMHALKSEMFQSKKEYIVQEFRPHIRQLVDTVKFYLTIVDWKNKTCVSPSFVVCFQNKCVLSQKQTTTNSFIQQPNQESNFNPILRLDKLFEDMEKMKD